MSILTKIFGDPNERELKEGIGKGTIRKIE